MPKQSQQQIAPRPIVGSQTGARQVKGQVSATATDALPAYIPQSHDPDLEGFVKGLAEFQPSLQNMLHEAQARNADEGQADALASREAQKDEPSYSRAYHATTGIVKGQEDASALVQKYNTEFDKDKGDLDGFLVQQYQDRLKGIQDKDYLSGYNKAMAPAMEGLRKQHLDYQRKAVEATVESNAMQMLDGGIRAYVFQSQPVPDNYVASIKDYMGKNLGVTPQRFDELLFDSIRRVGDEGHIEAYDLLKKDHPDGTPGLYFNPAWKHKVEQAEEHSYTLWQTKAHKLREDKQDQILFPVFAEPDPKKAQAMFAEAKASGLFTRASDLIKWDKLLTEKLDGKPDTRQLENENKLLVKVYQGQLGYKDVLNSNSTGDITAGQRKYLLSEIRKVQTENRSLALQAQKEGEAVYKSTEYRSAKDFLEGALQPRPRDPMNFNGQQTIEFDRAQVAQASLEFTRASKGKRPEELQPLVEEITNRYMKRRSTYSDAQQAAVGTGQIPFKSLHEVMEAAKKGLLSADEYRTYSNYFKGMNAR